MNNLRLSEIKSFAHVHESEECRQSQKSNSGLHDFETCDTGWSSLRPHFTTKGKNVTPKQNSIPIPHL